MKEVYALLVSVDHFKPYHRSDMLRAVCKTKEAVIRVANDEIKELKTLFKRWGTSDFTNFDDRDVTEDGMFNWEDVLETRAAEHTFYTDYDDNGMRKQEWHLYVMKMPIEE